MAAAKLPYKMLGGIVPCPGGWLIVPARLAGVTVVAEDPEVVTTLLDVLEFKPKFDAAAIYARSASTTSPPGRTARATRRPATSSAGRADRHAPDAVACRAARRDPRAEALELEPWLTRDDFRRFKWLREAEREFQPFHQRIVLRRAPRPHVRAAEQRRAAAVVAVPAGRRARAHGLIRDKMPGVEEIVTRTPRPVPRRCTCCRPRACCGRPAAPPAGRCNRLPAGSRLGLLRHAHGTRPLTRTAASRESLSRAPALRRLPEALDRGPGVERVTRQSGRVRRRR